MKFCIDMNCAAECIRDLGYRAHVNEEGAHRYIESAAHGLDFRVYFYGEEPAGSGKFSNYQLEAGMAIGSHVNLNQLALLCNKFNDNYRFLKALFSLGKSDYVGLQMDCEAGAESIDKLRFDAEFFIHGMSIFVEDIVKSRIIPNDETSSLHTSALQHLYGLNPDPDRGLLDYMSAAHEGFAGSQNNLGDLYENGQFVAKSEVYAAYWYARAAERGEPTAYLSLSTLFAKSSDRQILIDAAKFAFLAVQSLKDGKNRQFSINCLSQLRTQLSESDIELAEKLARHWLPLYQERRLLSDTVGGSIEEASRSKH